MGGSPASAGIDPWATCAKLCCKGFPRKCGDRPMERDGDGKRQRVPPQVRG